MKVFHELINVIVYIELIFYKNSFCNVLMFVYEKTNHKNFLKIIYIFPIFHNMLYLKIKNN